MCVKKDVLHTAYLDIVHVDTTYYTDHMYVSYV